jgi:SdpC family antimicrobial peptide
MFAKQLLVVVLLGINLVSCGQSKSPQSHTLNAHQTYLSVFFGQGELGMRLQRIWNPYQFGHTRSQLASLSRLGEQTLARILSQNRGFLEDFAVEVSSGDPLRVQNELINARHATMQAFGDYRVSDSQPFEPTPGTFIATDSESVAFMESTTFVVFTSEFVKVGLRYLEPQTTTERLVKDTIVSIVTEACYLSL